MQNTDGLTPIDRELEAALGGLRVAPATISSSARVRSTNRAMLSRTVSGDPTAAAWRMCSSMARECGGKLSR